MQNFHAARRWLSFVLVLSLAALTPLAALADDFAMRIEKAHGGDAWDAHQALEVPISVSFGGNTILDGTLLMDTPGGRTRLELKDGTVLVFDGSDAWVAPADSKFQGGRFHALTWSYFLAAPMKLDDPGSQLEDLGEMPFRDNELAAARLTFGDGVGDSPDDWYIAYRDDADHLAGMAYIVTFSKSVEEAEKEPHAIVYGDWVDVDGVQVATEWSFHNWNEEEGIVGDPIGHAELGTPKFVEPAADAFNAPQGARKEAAPGE